MCGSPACHGGTPWRRDEWAIFDSKALATACGRPDWIPRARLTATARPPWQQLRARKWRRLPGARPEHGCHGGSPWRRGEWAIVDSKTLSTACGGSDWAPCARLTATARTPWQQLRARKWRRLPECPPEHGCHGGSPWRRGEWAIVDSKTLATACGGPDWAPCARRTATARTPWLQLRARKWRRLPGARPEHGCHGGSPWRRGKWAIVDSKTLATACGGPDWAPCARRTATARSPWQQFRA